MATATFTISNGWAPISIVKISATPTTLPDVFWVSGVFRNVTQVTLGNGINFSDIDNLSSITIDHINPVQGTKAVVDAAIQKVVAAVASNTGSVMLNGKNLVILTGL